MTTLGQAASLVRSKNAGPFWTTIDAFFPDDASYRQAAASPLTDRAVIAEVYGIAPASVEVFELERLRAIKVSFPRPTVQGSLDDTDLHAGQQYVPLLSLELTEPFELTEPLEQTQGPR
jgi:hypothetical protein